jgi:nucleoside-diphosphate-sugar epimerase
VARFPVSLRKMDLLDTANVRAVVDGARWLFHCAVGTDGANAARVTVEGTRNVVEAAIAVGCEVVVVLSSAAVFGAHQCADVNESSAYAPSLGDYGLSKMLMEAWCLWRARSSGKTRIVVLNPTCVYGPGGRTYSELPVRLATEGCFCWVENGCGTANYTYVGNLVDAMLAVASRTDAHARRFIISDGATSWRTFLTPLLGPRAEGLQSYTRDQLMAMNDNSDDLRVSDLLRALATDEQYLALLRRTRLFRGMKHLAALCAPALLQKAKALKLPLESMPAPARAVPPTWLADLFGSSTTVYSSQDARSAIPWQPRISLSEGQERTTQWLRETRLL